MCVSADHPPGIRASSNPLQARAFRARVGWEAAGDRTVVSEPIHSDLVLVGGGPMPTFK